MLIAVGGLPGTGKSSVVDAGAPALMAPVLAKDEVEATLRRCGITDAAQSGWIAYEMLGALAAAQLRRGLTVILDSVMTTESIRTEWRRIASDAGVPFRAVECICSDAAAHRSRLEGRVRGIQGWPELEWPDVEEVRTRYESWTTPRLVLDSMNPLDANVAALLDYVRAPGRCAR